MTLNEAHRKHLEDHAIDIDLAEELGVYSAETEDDLPDTQRYLADRLPAIVFPWAMKGVETIHQVRPDDPGDGAKYLFEAGRGSAIWATHKPKKSKRQGVLLIEGTKQALAVASLKPDWLVLGMGGCSGWSSHGAVTYQLTGVAEGLPLVAIIDADLRSNPSVHDAAKGMLEKLGAKTGATSVAVTSTPGSGVLGVDDYLAALEPSLRRYALDDLIEGATTRIGRRPRARAEVPDGMPEDLFNDGGKVNAETLARWMDEQAPWAVGEDVTSLYRYKRSTGTYIQQLNVGARLAGLLGDNISNVHTPDVEKALVSIAHANGRIIESDPSTHLIALSNGVLDPDTGVFSAHSPDHRLTTHWNVAWEPTATCPTIMSYLERRMPGQVDAFLDTASRLLDRDRLAQDRVLFLFGPRRSGKSTALSLLLEMVGADASTAITLHQLASDRFIAARLAGKALNVAADLSDELVSDSSMFKMLTGGDLVSVQRKYESPFDMKWRGLMAFSANEVPRLNGDVEAELARIVPVACPMTFAGDEDEAVKATLYAELPGLLVELVKRHQVQPMPRPLHVVAERFRSDVDRVSTFIDRATELVDYPEGVQRKDLHDAFKLWLWRNGYGQAMSTHSFYKRLTSMEIEARKIDGAFRFPLRLLSEDEQDDFSDPYDDWVEGLHTLSPGALQTADDESGGVPGTMRKGDSDSHLSEAHGAWLLGALATESPDWAPNWPEAHTLSPGALQTADDESGGVPGTMPDIPHVTPDTSEAHTLSPGALQTAVDESGGVPGTMQSGQKRHNSHTSDSRGDEKREKSENSNERELFEDFCPEIPDSPSESAKPLVDHEIPEAAATKPLVDPQMTLCVDLETASSAELFDGRADFVRLVVLDDRVAPTVTDGLVAIFDHLDAGGTVSAHNGFGFDFLALAIEAERLGRQFDPVALADAGQLVDTMIVSICRTPPMVEFGKSGSAERVMREHSLVATAERLGIEVGKLGDLKALARKHGGFDKIPLDDPEYVGYAQRDGELQVAVTKALGDLSEYEQREMRIMARLADSITLTGFKVDQRLLAHRIAEGVAREKELTDWLISEHGLPTTLPNGKVAKKPAATKAGQEALLVAFESMGLDRRHIPTTKTGAPSLGKDALDELSDLLNGLDGVEPGVFKLIEAVRAVNGIRTVYDTAAQYVRKDGRTHSSVLPLQASGRFSVRQPGLTVFGKRGGKHVERDIFVAGEGSSLVAFDLNQIDSRAVAAHCQDANYLKLFTGEHDIHTATAIEVLGDAKYREEAKVLNHGVNYGMGPEAMVKHAHKVGATSVTDKMAQDFVHAMDEKFPALKLWKDDQRERAELGDTLDNGFGRRMKADGQRAYTQAPALMGQGGARDLMMESLLRMPVDVAGMVRAIVHDEFVLEIPDDRLDEVIAAVLAAMTFEWAPSGQGVPIEAGFDGPAKSWGRCYVKG